MTPTRPELGPILLGTVVVPDLEAAVAAYTATFGWVVQHEGSVDAGLAGLWQTPLVAGARHATVGSTPTRPGGVRLVERRGRELRESPLRAPGWRCLELCVEDVHAARARVEGSPFTALAGPASLGPDSPIWAFQALGPGRVMHYLTQTVLDSGFDIPLAEHPVDRLFIAVLSTPDMAATLAWYKQRFATGIELAPEALTLVACCTDAGTDPTATHRITALGLAGQALVEIDDHFPGVEGERPPAGDLRSGIAHVTWEVESLAAPALAGSLLAPPVTRVEPPYAGRRVAVAVGSAGELLELVERASPSA